MIIIKLGTLDSVGFSCSSLSICEYCSVITLKTSVSYWFCYLIENCFLIDLLICYNVKSKFFYIRTTIKLDHSIICLNAFNDTDASFFSFNKRSDSDTDFHIVFLMIVNSKWWANLILEIFCCFCTIIFKLKFNLLSFLFFWLLQNFTVSSFRIYILLLKFITTFWP